MITPSRRGGHTRLAIACLFSLTLVAACGSDDESAESESTPAPLVETTEAPETTATEPTTAPSAGGFPLTLENCGVKVTVDSPPERAVTMNQAATEVALALGLEDQLVGTAYLDDEIIPEFADAYAAIPVLSDEYPSTEVLFAAEPDFVYGSYASAFADEAAGDRAALQAAGVGSYLSIGGCPSFRESGEALAFDDVFGEFADVAAIFGASEEGEELVSEQQELVASADVSGLGDLTVLWWDDALDAPSVGACCGAPAMLMTALGVTNEFGGEPGSWATVNWEQVVADDPDVIVLVDASWSLAADKEAHLRSDPALQNLSAVVNDRLVTIPFSATTPGVRNAPAVADLAEAIRALDLEG